MPLKTVCNIDQCAGCMACIDICPVAAITIQDSLKAYNAVIDNEKCIGCNACHRVCQSNNPATTIKPVLWKQGWAEESIRSMSSSGGFGTAILKAFIGDSSYIAACCFKDGKFVFDITNNPDEVWHFTGSKYVKSNPIGIFKNVKKCLQNHNRVLFIGLPCQVSSMRNYIGETLSTNLYTVDLICHGSPSPQLLEASMNEYGFNLKNVKNIAFRKNANFGLRTNSKKIVPERVQDRYLMAFLRGLCYTENCYNCQYAQINRVGDLTIGDSWGTDLEEEMRNGVSLALCQTKKGEELLLNSGLELKEVDIQKAIENNNQLRSPSDLPPERMKFFEILSESGNFNESVAQVYKKDCIKQDVKQFLISHHILRGGGERCRK